ncbi:hypothetical protein [Streptoalloteichus tenebrarius]|uniref:hypothetical protein n=1 Tax=Streptoalloteichus tenebrarius (strain ATCC 17920 / DSM 40477 / JCM 4838 / CBS 697.72 / NBRC 16177 / NCIMB 11028 / NRRL B-12390 / A12253. 1 / ISP 5477) TaxID=1933 RepID=UPI0020A2E50C|nr:hypothetical protein [Streptoalloteichus tenebrarius]BFE98670.1 hypothetical protein GCM10020241_03460 [Streptoalloteichus tenebrarius]
MIPRRAPVVELVAGELFGVEDGPGGVGVPPPRQGGVQLTGLDGQIPLLPTVAVDRTAGTPPALWASGYQWSPASTVSAPGGIGLDE